MRMQPPGLLLLLLLMGLRLLLLLLLRQLPLLGLANSGGGNRPGIRRLEPGMSEGAPRPQGPAPMASPAGAHLAWFDAVLCLRFHVQPSIITGMQACANCPVLSDSITG
jgi:hypothetical protein